MVVEAHDEIQMEEEVVVEEVNNNLPYDDDDGVVVVVLYGEVHVQNHEVMVYHDHREVPLVVAHSII